MTPRNKPTPVRIVLLIVLLVTIVICVALACSGPTASPPLKSPTPPIPPTTSLVPLTTPPPAPPVTSVPPKVQPQPFIYTSCAEVRAAGAAPLHRNDRGWNPKLDRDGDGVACE
jgi:hypothetical protein